MSGLRQHVKWLVTGLVTRIYKFVYWFFLFVLPCTVSWPPVSCTKLSDLLASTWRPGLKVYYAVRYGNFVPGQKRVFPFILCFIIRLWMSVVNDQSEILGKPVWVTVSQVLRIWYDVDLYLHQNVFLRTMSQICRHFSCHIVFFHVIIPCVRKVAVHLGTSRSAESVCE